MDGSDGMDRRKLALDLIGRAAERRPPGAEHWPTSRSHREPIIIRRGRKWRPIFHGAGTSIHFL